LDYLQQFRQRHSEYNDLSDQEVLDGLYRNHYSDLERSDFDTRMAAEVPIPDDEGEIDFGTAVGAGVDILQQGLYSAAEGVGESLDVDFLKEFGREGVERQKEDLAKATGLQQFREIGGVGDTAEFALEQIGQQLPIMAPMLAGSLAGAKIGAGIGALGANPVTPAIGGAIGAIAGGALAGIPLFYGQNRERQKEVSGSVQSEGAAFLTAIPQAAAESVISAVTLGVGKVGAPAITNLLYSGGGVFTRAARGFGGGALVEVPTEIGQQALERMQAGLEVFSEDAELEYIDAAAAALFVGGAFGTAGNVAFGNRQTLAEMRAEADDTALKSDLETLLANESVEVDDLTDQEIMEFAEKNRENDPLFAYIVDSGLAEATKIKTLRRRMSEVFTGVLSENQIQDPLQADGYNPLQIAKDQADRRGPALGTFQDVDTDGTIREETVVANRGTDPATLLLSDEETIQVAAQYAERYPEINEILKAEVEPKIKVRLLRRKLRELIPATEATGTGTAEIRAGDFSTELQEERGGIAPGAEGAPRLADRTGQPAERGALLEQEQADQAIAEDILARGEQEREDSQRRTTETLEAASATVSPTSELTDQQFETGQTLEAAGRVLRGEQASTLGPEAVATVEGERGNVPTFRAVQDARERVNGLLDKLEGVGSGGIEAARAVRERIEQRNLTGDQALGMLRGAEAFAETLPVDAKNVQLRFLDKVMLGAAAAEASGGGATAQEGPGRRLSTGNGLDGIVEISLGEPSSVIRSTAAHEAFHVMQDVYADVDPGAANILNRAFGRPNETKRLKDLPSGIIRMLKKAEFAPGASFWKELTANESKNAAPIQSGELQAYSYQAYNLLKNQGKKVPGLGGAMSRYMIFNKKFFERLGNSLRGDGFRTATEVFAEVPQTARQRADGGVQSQTVAGEQASVLDRLARRATGVEQVQDGNVTRRFGMRDVPDLIRQRMDAGLPTQEITSLLEDTDVTSEQASALALRGMRELEPRLEEFNGFDQTEYSFEIDQPFSFDLDIAGTEDSTQVQHDFQMRLSRNPNQKWKDTYVAFTIDGSYSQQRDNDIEYLASRISTAADRGDFEKAVDEVGRLTRRAAEKNYVDPTVNSPEFEAFRDFASNDKSTRDKKVDDLKNLILQQQRITKKHNTRVASELFPLASAMVARHIREDRPNILQFSSSSKTGSRSRIYHKAGQKIADEYGYEVRTFYDDESKRHAHQYILSPETAAQLDAFTHGLPEFLGMTENDKNVFSESPIVSTFLSDVLPDVVREGADGINKFARNIKEIVEDLVGIDLVADRLGTLDASAVRQIADLFGLTATSKDLTVEERRNKDADQSALDRLRRSLFSDDGGITEQASTLALTMERLDQRIPQADRVASPNPRAPLTANSFTSILGGNGGGFNGNQADINRIFEESIAETDDDGGTTARDAVKAVKMRAPSADFWNKAFKMPNRVRYWYEASAEAFRDLTNFRSPEALSRFIDIVSGTSGGVEPYPNLMRAMGVASEDAQGIPIRTDLRDPASATKALAPSDLNTLKFGNFAGTMQFINGLTPKAPLSTNDTQVASAFGFPGTALASKPILYEVLSRFYQKLRDVQNSGIAAGEQPYESWQIQALGWVEERGRKKETKQNVSDDYGEALPKIISTLQANGVPVPNGQITETTLQDARVPNLMSGTRRYFDQGRFATVETASELTPEGKRAAEIYEYLRGREEIPWVRDAKKKYVRQQRIPMEKLARRKASGKINPKTKKAYGADPSLLSNIMSELVGTKVEVSRVDPRNFTGWGTFESVMSPNLRIPMQFRVMETQGFASLTPVARRALLAMLGKALGQKAMAASQFTPAADPANPDTFRVFVQTTDPANFNPTVIETFEKDAGGFPLNIEEVPNGYTIDLNIGGFDVGPNLQTVQDAVTKNLGNQDATIVPMDYASDYIEENGYVDTNGDFQAVDGYDSFINELLEQDDASQIRNDTRGVGRGNRVEARSLRSNITRYAAQLEEISAARDDGFREWSDGVEGLLSKERRKEDERRAKQARISTKDTLNAAKAARKQMRTTGEQASVLSVDTPAFKNWFKQSKVVDNQGNPLVVYHGTTADFDTFDATRGGGTTGAPDARKGFFFSSDPEIAASYAEMFDTYVNQFGDNRFSKMYADFNEALLSLIGAPSQRMHGAQVMPVYISIQNPFTLDMRAREYNPQVFSDTIDAAKNAGHDGVIVKNTRDSGFELTENQTSDIFIPFRPTQIKSVFNRGTFDPQDARIQASTLGYNPIFAAGAQPRPIKSILSKLIPTSLKEFRQQMVNGFDPLADLEMRVNSGKLRDATRSAFKMAELSLQLTGRTESFLLNGPPVFNQETGGVSANTEIGGLKNIFEPIGAGEKYLRFQDYAYARRADELINDPMAQEIINPTTGKVSYPALDAARAELAQSTNFINRLKEQPRSPERDKNIRDFSVENQRFKNQVKRVEKSIEVKKNLEESFPAELRQQALALGNPEFDQVLDRYKAFNDAMLQYLVDTGLISEAQREGMARTSLYVPFYKLADEDAKEMNPDVIGPQLRSGLSNPDAGIKALTGEGGQIGDLYENVIRNAQTFLGAGLRNEAMRRSVDLMGEAEIGGVQREKGPTTVTYKVGGQDKHYNIAKPNAAGQIDPDAPALFTALTSFSRPQTEGIVRAMETVANIFRSGITISPGFMVANFIRGDLAGAVTTDGHLRLLIDSTIGLKAALSNNQSVQDLKQQSGVGGYAFGGRPKGFASKLKRDFRKGEEVVGVTTKMSDVLANLWGKAEAVGEATELATREAIFRRMQEAGFNDVEAAYQALALVNYSRRGNPDSLAATALAQIIPLVPFLNARVQGLYRTASAVSGKEANAKGTILKGMALTGASMALYALSSGDERWKEEPIERKLNYYIFYPTKDTKILIPKPFEVGAIFSTIPEFFTDLVMGNITGKDAARAAKMTVLNTFGFNPAPQAVLPIFEVIANYDFFTDRALETAGVQRLPSGDRAYSTTSQTAAAFGQATGLSPIKFEQIIKGYLGSMGSLGLSAVDAVLSTTGAVPAKPAGIFENEIGDAASFLTGLTRFVKESPDSANKFVGDFYELKREVDEIYAAVQDRRKNGEVEAAMDLMRENRKKLGARSSLNSMQKTMSTLNREIQRVKRTERMDSNEKKQRLQRLINQRNRVAGQTERILERIN
jgi:hypothetical protein